MAKRSPRSLVPAPDAPTQDNPRPRRYWTNHEVETLRRVWPQGIEAALEALPGRSPAAIYTKASALGIKAGHGDRVQGSTKRRKYIPTPEIDAAIAEVYQGKPKSGAVNELAARLELPRWWVSKRARKLGLTVPRFKEPAWSAAEDELLVETFKYSPSHARRLFAKAGFKRTAVAIVNRRKRLGLRARTRDDVYTASRVAKMLGLDPSTVTTWIEQGLIEAWLRGTKRTPQQGGDGYYIAPGTLRKFIRDNPERIDLRKVDRLWFLAFAFGEPRRRRNQRRET